MIQFDFILYLGFLFLGLFSIFSIILTLFYFSYLPKPFFTNTFSQTSLFSLNPFHILNFIIFVVLVFIFNLSQFCVYIFFNFNYFSFQEFRIYFPRKVNSFFKCICNFDNGNFFRGLLITLLLNYGIGGTSSLLHGTGSWTVPSARTCHCVENLPHVQR